MFVKVRPGHPHEGSEGDAIAHDALGDPHGDDGRVPSKETCPNAKGGSGAAAACGHDDDIGTRHVASGHLIGQLECGAHVPEVCECAGGSRGDEIRVFSGPPEVGDRQRRCSQVVPAIHHVGAARSLDQQGLPGERRYRLVKKNARHVKPEGFPKEDRGGDLGRRQTSDGHDLACPAALGIGEQVFEATDLVASEDWVDGVVAFHPDVISAEVRGNSGAGFDGRRSCGEGEPRDRVTEPRVLGHQPAFAGLTLLCSGSFRIGHCATIATSRTTCIRVPAGTLVVL